MNASVDSAGLVLGVATIIGGIGGTLLGSKVAEYYNSRVKNAYFLIPALFQLCGAVLLIFAINATKSFVWSAALATLTELMVWTYAGPISTISISTVPSHVSGIRNSLPIIIDIFILL